MKLVTSVQMRALEQRAVETGVTLDTLMENAGLAVAQEAWLALGVLEGRRILVLTGAGNNGGDALVAARHLADWDAEVTVYAPMGRAGADPRLAPVLERGVSYIGKDQDDDRGQLTALLHDTELIIDGLLGIGRNRGIEGALAETLSRLRARQEDARPPQVIAIDLPTGIDADSGHADPLAVRADMTVTLGLAKPGLYALPGSKYTGRIEVVDIGIPRAIQQDLPLELLATPWVRERLPARPIDANKGTFGKVLLVAGSRQYVGAARLSAEACYRAGAGLVAVACGTAVQAALAPALPEATYVLLGDTNALNDEGADRVIDVLPSCDVLLIGPGLSQEPGVREAVTRVLASAPENIRACVVDADALNALAAADGWAARMGRPGVLTPHPGEIARLLGTSVEAVQADRLNVAMHASVKWGQVVVLKGAHTVVAAPDGRAAISPHANPLLAIGGTGDVLAGAIAGFVAQGAEPFEAAACAVYANGVAADEMSDEFGDRGMLASELARALPSAIRIIREGKRASGATPFAGLSGLVGMAGGGGIDAG